MPDTKSQKEWLRKARKILSSNEKDQDRLAMKNSGGAIVSLLNALDDMNPKPTGYAGVLEEYNAISRKALAAAEMEGSKVKKGLIKNTKALTKEEEQQQKQKIREVSNELLLLQEKMERMKLKAEEEKKEFLRQQELGAARNEYTARVNNVSRQVDILKTDPYAKPEPLELIVEQARTTASVESVKNFRLATQQLSGMEKKIETATKNAKQAREDERVDLKQKPATEQKFFEATERLRKLEALPGVVVTGRSSIAVFHEILAEAERLMKEGKWAKAAAEIEKAKNSQLVAPDTELEKVGRENVVSLKKTYPAYQTAEDLLNQLASLTDETSAGERAAEFKKVTSFLLDKANVGTRTKKIEEHAAGLKRELERVTPLHQELETTSAKLTDAYNQLKEKMPAIELAYYDSLYQEFQNLRSAKLLDHAMESGAELLPQFEDELKARNADYDEWAKGLGEATELEQELGVLASSPCASVPKRAASLRGLVAKATISRLTTEKNWTQLADNLKQAKHGLPELKKIDSDYTAFANRRDSADQEFKDAFEETKTALAELGEAVRAAVKSGEQSPTNSTGKFGGEIDQIEKDWKANLLSASDEESLGLRTAIGKLTDIQKEIAGATSEDGIKDILKQDEQDRNDKLFAQSWSAFEKSANALQPYSLKAWTKLKKDGKQLRDLAATDSADAHQKLVRLTNGAANLLLEAQQQQQKDVNALNQIAAQAEQQIKNTKAAVKHKRFDKVFEAMTTEFAELKQMGTSTSMDAISEARTGLEGLLERAKKLATDTSGNGPMEEVIKRLDEVHHAWEEIRDKVKENSPKTFATLAKQWTALKTEALTIEPSAALPKLESFNRSTWEAKLDSDSVEEIRSEFDEQYPDVKTSLENFTKRQTAPKYAESLKKRLEAAKAETKDPDKLFQANLSLKTISDDIKAATLDRKEGLKKEGELVAREKTDEFNKTEYNRGIKVLREKHFGAAKVAVESNDGDPGLIKELKRMATVAENSAKNGDYVAALDQIQTAIGRARQIVDDPFGATIGSRKNLPKDLQIYKKAVTGFRNYLLKEFTPAAELDPALAGMNPSVSEAMEKILKKLTAKFDLTAFDATVRDLTAKAPPDQLRASREEGISAIHTIQTFLEKNPQIRALIKNPIQTKEFSLAYRKLVNSLVRLETNISRCCK